MYPGKIIPLWGYDTMTSHGDNKPKSDAAKSMNTPPETVRVITVKTSGFPKARLDLKIGVSVMLLRNLRVHQKLCNGTQLIVKGIGR